MSWSEHHPAMLRRTGGLRATGSPADFPTAEELDAARHLDELCREINDEHDREVDALADAVDRRLDRIHETGKLLTGPLAGLRRKDGFTVVEIIVALAVVAMLALVVVSTFGNMGHEARLAKCAANMYTMSAAVDDIRMQTPGHRPPSIRMYNFYHPRISPTFEGIFYIPDGDPNAGHGNDIDFCDEENPGQGRKRDCEDIDYVLVCNHDHGGLAQFVYMVNDGVPTLAMHPGQVDAPFVKDYPYDDDPPDYSRFIKLAYKDGGAR